MAQILISTANKQLFYKVATQYFFKSFLGRKARVWASGREAAEEQLQEAAELPRDHLRKRAGFGQQDHPQDVQEEAERRSDAEWKKQTGEFPIEKSLKFNTFIFIYVYYFPEKANFI